MEEDRLPGMEEGIQAGVGEGGLDWEEDEYSPVLWRVCLPG